MKHTIRIEKIVHGGLGLGRLETGIVTLTPFVVPGETVVVQEIQRQRGYILTEPLSILEPSQERIDPLCPWYMQCGGCDLQHMNITAQHQAKRNVLSESLQRAGVNFNASDIPEVVASPQQYHYRYRIRLKVSANGSFGFHKSQSNEIIEITKCPIASEAINTSMEELRTTGFIEKTGPYLTEIELLHSPADDNIFCVLHSRSELSSLQTLLKNTPVLESVAVMAVKNGRRFEVLSPGKQEWLLNQNYDETLCGHAYSLHWSAGCFSQVNANQNINLVRLANQLLGDINGQQVLDLFCGMGNFSIPLALQGAVVTGVERNAECIVQASSNASRLGISTTRFVDSDVHKWLRRAVKHSTRFNTVIADPPRQGIGKYISLVSALSPSRILYISCDPATLARDIFHLSRDNYKLASITPVDMFPQTHHIESVALLEKN